jgi:phosphoribosylaminoimidazole-succinocarboxamide synthase
VKKVKKLNRSKPVYRGKYTEVFAVENEPLAVVEFNDNLVSLDSKKRLVVRNKKEASCTIAQRLFEYLQKYNVPHYFVEKHGESAILVQSVEYVPVQVVVRNFVSPALARRFGLKEGTALEHPVLEYFYDNEKFGYPSVNNYHLHMLKVANREELGQINELAFKVNAVLRPFLARRGYNLVDCELTVGRQAERFVLAGPVGVEDCSLSVLNGGADFDREALKSDPKDIRTFFDDFLAKIGG